MYDVLQVSPWCEQDVIQAAYRALARTRHPDVNRDRDAEEQMRRLNVAYQTLSDPVQRARYDEELALESARIASPRPATPSPADVAHFSTPTAPGPYVRAPRQPAPAPASAPAYQAVVFDQRGEGMYSRPALYLLVVLVTVVLAFMVYVVIDFVAADRSVPAQRGPRGQFNQPWTAGGVSTPWLFEGLDADARPGLSPSGDRWNR